MVRRRSFAVLLTCCLFWAVSAWAGDKFSLTILHTNDIHGYFAAFDDPKTFCATGAGVSGQCSGGGVARLATAVARERAKDGPSILVDAGDQFQGTLFYTKYLGGPSAFFMNRLGYDAMTLGNHEFDNGSFVLAKFLRALHFPVVAANLGLRDTSPLQGLVVPYCIKEVAGHRIGIIGAVQPKASKQSSPGTGVTFPKTMPAIQACVTTLRQQGVDAVIVLSHLGFKGDQKLAATVAGIAVIVGGHSHVLLGNGYPEAVGPCPLEVAAPDGGHTVIVTTGCYGRYLGVLHVVFDGNGRVSRAAGNPVRLDASVPEDPDTLREVERLAAPFASYWTRGIGQAEAPLTMTGCRRRECTAGDTLAEAMREAGRPDGAVAALIDSVCVRGDIPAGPVAYAAVLTAYPRPNKLVVLTLSGEALAKVLERGLSALGAHEGSGRFLQVAGLRYAYNPDRPKGERLGAVQVADATGRFAPLDRRAGYRIAISDFLYRGGNGFTLFHKSGRDVVHCGLDLDDLTAQWITTHSPVRPVLDGRIAVTAD